MLRRQRGLWQPHSRRTGGSDHCAVQQDADGHGGDQGAAVLQGRRGGQRKGLQSARVQDGGPGQRIGLLHAGRVCQSRQLPPLGFRLTPQYRIRPPNADASPLSSFFLPSCHPHTRAHTHSFAFHLAPASLGLPLWSGPALLTVRCFEGVLACCPWTLCSQWLPRALRQDPVRWRVLRRVALRSTSTAVVAHGS